MNRKTRKQKKMKLKRLGLESFIPAWDSLITTSSWNFPHKIAKHFKDGQIQAGKMRGYEFTRPIKNQF